MTISTETWTDEVVEVAGQDLHVRRGGSGPPLLVLHGEMGNPGPLPCYDDLAAHYRLTLPTHPGFGKTARVAWVESIRDLAAWYLEALDDLGVEQTALLGCGIGGWLAAEMAIMSPQQVSRLVLASSQGIRPPSGEIFDMFLVVAKDYIDRGFADRDHTPGYQDLYGAEPTPEQNETWFSAREASCRLAWRPYMHDLTLVPRLHRLKRVPTLILWGRDNAIVPLSVADAYQAAIPGARLIVVDGCGHYPEIEQPEAFVQHVYQFLQAA